MFNLLTLKRNAEVISSLCAFALLILLPIFVLPLSWVTLAESKVLLVVGLLPIIIVSWAFTSFLDGGVYIPRGWILVSAALLPIASVISTVLSGVREVSLVGSGVEQDTLVMVCIWYVVLVTMALMCSVSVIKNIFALRSLFIGVLILDVFQWIHLFFPSFTSIGGVFAGQTANLLGGWYELGIFSGLFLFLALACQRTPVADRGWKYLLWIVAILSFGLLFVINTLDVWIALSVISVSYVALDVIAGRHWYQLRYLHTWRPYVLWLALGIICVLIASFGSLAYNHLPTSIQISTSEVRPSWRGTLVIGSHALTQPAKLVFGTGPNTFTREWVLHKPLEINQTIFWNTDFESGVGSIPTSLISLGLVGAVAWILFIISILWTGLRLAHSSPRQGAGSLVEPLFIGVLFLLAFHILYVPGPALSIMTFLLLGIAIGYATALGRISHLFVNTAGGTLPSRTAFVGLLVFVGIGIVSCVVVAKVNLAEILINKSIVTYNTTQDLGRSSRLVASALRIYPSNTRGQRAAVELGILQVRALASTTAQVDTALLKTTVENTIRYGLQAVSIESDNYQNWLELATLYQELAGAQVQGAYENAQEAYAKIIAQNPNNPYPYFQRARLELLQNKPDAALTDLATAVRLKP
ncbi:MAG: tetratricopeptide repeat protein, partial [Nitrososphaera sp.]|nr:tetratricopeptide repeat protein [Nitrososphaera sp.]